VTCRPLLWLLAVIASSATAQIERIDPPHWWVDMVEPQVQLMVYGPNVADSHVSSDSADIEVIASHRGDSNNYLFVDLKVNTGAKAGSVTLNFSARDGRITEVPYALHARRKGSTSRQGFSAKDVIYLIVPDRFANGDTSNDSIDSLTDRHNPEHPYGRHGGDLQGVIAHLDYLETLGVTQLWMTPALENNQLEGSYHGYAVTDLYNVDARMGDNALYRALSEAAAERGIGLIHDFVPNHIGSEHPWMKDLPTRDWINNGGTFISTNHRREANEDIHAAAADQEAMTRGWFVPTMPDLNQTNSLLATYLIQNLIWWIEEVDLSGVRVDTWPYNDKSFLVQMTDRIALEYPNLSLVGEEWSYNPAIVAYWQRGKANPDGYNSGAPQMMDFPINQALKDALMQEEDWDKGLTHIYQMLANDFLYASPNDLVLIADNHDMDRLYRALDNDLARYKMAMTFLMTTRGIPQFLYGTEILMSNEIEHHHGLIRTNFPGGWPNDSVDGFTQQGLSSAQIDAQDFMTTLLNWRKTATAVHDGELLHYGPLDGLYVYFRKNEAQTIMVVLNNAGESRVIDANRYTQGIGPASRARDVLALDNNHRIDGLVIPAKSARVFELQ
jgi:glycosidase